MKRTYAIYIISCLCQVSALQEELNKNEYLLLARKFSGNIAPGVFVHKTGKGVGKMNQIVRCIGITGLNGAGKTSLANFLKENFAVDYYEVRTFLEKEREERGLPKGRESLALIANLLREKYGPDYIIRTLAERAMMNSSHNPFIIESIRCIGEIDYLAGTFREAFVLVGIDALLETRYERVLQRGSQTDKVTFDDFCTQELNEASQKDPWKQNLHQCMKKVTDGFMVWNEVPEEKLHVQIRWLASDLSLSPVGVS